MPLLGTSFDDPQTQSILALAGNMVRGDFGGGLLGAGQAYQQAQEGLLKRQDLQQQISLRNIALQQQQQEWALQLPMLKAMAERMQSGGAASGGGGLLGGASPSAPAIAPSAGGLLGSGTFGIPMGGQSGQSAPAQGPQSGGGTMFPGVPDNIAFPTAAFGGFKAVLPLMSKYNEPTELVKTMRAAGIPEGSAQWNETLQGNLAKTNYIAPVNARPGSILRDPRDPSKVVAFNPHIPDGTAPAFDPQGNVTGFQKLQNAEEAIGLASRAATFGKAEATPSVVYRNGIPGFSTVAQDVTRATGAAPSAQNNFSLASGASLTPELQTAIMADAQKNGISNPQLDIRPPQGMKTATLGWKPDGTAAPDSSQLVAPVLPPGVNEGAKLSQDELSKKGATLMADNANVSTVVSRLQNIKMLAPQAITGAESQRRDFMNGLLSLAGLQTATDAKTASDLVDKNAAQIVTALRMGQGGAGTDALQAQLNQANPSRHMTLPAINEAVDQLVAQQQMLQAKAKLLQPHYVGRDPVKYANTELQFDQNADPRVWQLLSMNPQEQAAYVKGLPPAVAADMLKKRQALRQIGAF